MCLLGVILGHIDVMLKRKDIGVGDGCSGNRVGTTDGISGTPLYIGVLLTSKDLSGTPKFLERESVNSFLNAGKVV